MANFTNSKQLQNHRILAGPSDIAGFTSRIAHAVAGAGANVLFFNANDHKYNPDLHSSTKPRRLLWRTIQLATLLKKGYAFERAIGYSISFLARILAFFVACTWANTIIMVGGKGLTGTGFEYYALRLLGKRVIHIFVGTASRPRYLSGYAIVNMAKNKNRRKAMHKIAKRTARQAARIRVISRYASIVIENPLCGHFQEAKFINFFKLGVPLNIDTLIKSAQTNGQTPHRDPNIVRILHCPSRPEIKGSAKIYEVINSLIQEGLPIELRLISNVPHEQVLYEISQADIVIDQLYSDSPLTGIAAEASAYGKVVLVGGYGWSLFFDFLAKQEIPPTIMIHPDELKEKLRSLVANPEYRKDIGKLGQLFMQYTWSESEFAKRFTMLLMEEVPEDWWFYPENVRYLHGMGMEESQCRLIIKDLIELAGIQSLKLGRHHAVKEMFIKFAEGESLNYSDPGNLLKHV